MTLRDLMVESVTAHLNEGVSRIEKCLSLLSQAEIWHDPNEHVVSVGNLVLHLDRLVKIPGPHQAEDRAETFGLVEP